MKLILRNIRKKNLVLWIQVFSIFQSLAQTDNYVLNYIGLNKASGQNDGVNSTKK